MNLRSTVLLALLTSAAPALAASPLQMAIASCKVEKVQGLLGAGADPNAMDSMQAPVTRWLASGKCSDQDALATTRLLAEHGARFEGYSKKSGPSLLINLAHRHLPRTLAFLATQKGAGDPTEALESIASSADVESAHVLLEAGADPLARDTLSRASRMGEAAMVAEMMKYVKDKNSPVVQKAFAAGKKSDSVKASFLAAGLKPPAEPVVRATPCAPKELTPEQSALMKKLGHPSSACKFLQRCGDLLYIDCGAAVDGPAYYVDQRSGRVVSVCGGACMAGCTDCPPKGWSCDTGC